MHSEVQGQSFRISLIALALVLLAGLGGFAIYAGLWHNGGSSGPRDGTRAAVYARELLAAQCASYGAPCRMKALTEVLPGIWRAHMMFGDGSVRCADIKLDTFRPRGSQQWLGVTPC